MTTEASAGRTAWTRNLAAPIRSFLHAETGGAVILAAAAVLALLWANVSPSCYASVWETRLAIVLGDHELVTDLRGWINEGLMTLFFLVVGLEAKRELDLGELRERTRLAIPVVASLGGMVTAAAIYLAINAGGDGSVGWGVAVSTDTALALGALVAAHARARDPPARVPAHRRRHRRPRGAAGDRARLQRGRLGGRAGGGDRALRRAPGAALGRLVARAGRGARGRRHLAGDVRVGRRRGDRRPRHRPDHERLPAGARRSSSAAPSSRARSASSRRRSWPTRRARASPGRSRPTSACSTACIRGRAG